MIARSAVATSVAECFYRLDSGLPPLSERARIGAAGLLLSTSFEIAATGDDLDLLLLFEESENPFARDLAVLPHHDPDAHDMSSDRQFEIPAGSSNVRGRAIRQGSHPGRCDTAPGWMMSNDYIRLAQRLTRSG